MVLPWKKPYKATLQPPACVGQLPARPGTYVLPQLPLGMHRLEWRVEKDGEVQHCGFTFIIRDGQAPTVVCLHGLSVNIMPTMMIQLWATDFLQYSQDNITPTPQLKLGIRRAGTGTGFPFDANGQVMSSVIFTCADLGEQPVELWSLDAAGNAGFCETTLLVQDNNHNCTGNQGPYTACVYALCHPSPEDVGFEITGTNPLTPPFSMYAGGSETGCINFFLPPLGPDLKIRPVNYGNGGSQGVNGYDLTRLANHLNGTQPFTENQQWVAADTDLNGIIDSTDLHNCQWLLWGEPDSVANPGFRFYPLDFVFSGRQSPGFTDS